MNSARPEIETGRTGLTAPVRFSLGSSEKNDQRMPLETYLIPIIIASALLLGALVFLLIAWIKRLNRQRTKGKKKVGSSCSEVDEEQSVEAVKHFGVPVR